MVVEREFEDEPFDDNFGVCCGGAGCNLCARDSDDDGCSDPDEEELEEREGRRRGSGR